MSGGGTIGLSFLLCIASTMAFVAARTMPETRHVHLIPRLSDQNRCAQSRRPRDMMVQGSASSLFQASLH